jgi:hypothetical protein
MDRSQHESRIRLASALEVWLPFDGWFIAEDVEDAIVFKSLSLPSAAFNDTERLRFQSSSYSSFAFPSHYLSLFESIFSSSISHYFCSLQQQRNSRTTRSKKAEEHDFIKSISVDLQTFSGTIELSTF